MELGEYISLDTLAATLRLPRTYLRRLAREGKIPVLDVNGAMRFNEAQVREALRHLAAQQQEEAGRSQK